MSTVLARVYVLHPFVTRQHGRYGMHAVICSAVHLQGAFLTGQPFWHSSYHEDK